MIRTTPFRRMILHRSQRGLIDARTFMTLHILLAPRLDADLFTTIGLSVSRPPGAGAACSIRCTLAYRQPLITTPAHRVRCVIRPRE
jgi:hypothetical protein